MIEVTRVKPRTAPDYLIKLSPDVATWLAARMGFIYSTSNARKDIRYSKDLGEALDNARTRAELHGGYDEN